VSPVYDADLYGPLQSPEPPTRVKLLKLAAVLGVLAVTIVGAFWLARKANWLKPVAQVTRADTDGQGMIKSSIKYPVEPKALTPIAANGHDPDADWKRRVNAKLADHDRQLGDHEGRIKSLEEQMKAQKPAPTAQPTAQAQKPAPKPVVYRSMQFVSNKVEVKQTDEPGTYRLAAWSKISCTVETSISSDVTDSDFTFKVRNDIYDTDTGQHLLVPQGSTGGGTYRSSQLLSGNVRLPTVSLGLSILGRDVVELGEMPILDQKGMSGLVTRVDQRYWELLRAVLIMGVLRGGQQAIQYQIAANDPAAAVASGMASSASQAGQMRVGPALNTKPLIEVDAGEPCNLLLTKDLKLPAVARLGGGLRVHSR
jgi:type IV secretory pathway VirB10-like protein